MSKLILGSEIKIKLKRKKLRIEDLILKYNLNRATVSRYMNDHMAMPATFIVQVAEFANMSMDEFMIRDTEDQAETTVITPEPAPEVLYKKEDIKAKDYIVCEDPECTAQEPQAPYKKKSEKKYVRIDTSDLDAYIESLEERIRDLEMKMGVK